MKKHFDGDGTEADEAMAGCGNARGLRTGLGAEQVEQELDCGWRKVDKSQAHVEALGKARGQLVHPDDFGGVRRGGDIGLEDVEPHHGADGIALVGVDS